MKTLARTLAVVLLSATGLTLAVGHASQTNAAASEVTSLAKEIISATLRNDAAALDRMIATDYIGTSPAGQVLDKMALLKPTTDPSGSVAMDLDDIRVRTYGAAAVLTARRGVQVRGSAFYQRITYVFAREAKGWQLVTSHVTTIPS